MDGIVLIVCILVCVVLVAGALGATTPRPGSRGVAQVSGPSRCATKHSNYMTATPHGYMYVGMLVSTPGEPEFTLPLFGRQIRHDSYEYYTVTDKGNLWQISVQHQHRDCQDRLGCAAIADGDEVVVPQYANKTMRAVIYEAST